MVRILMDKVPDGPQRGRAVTEVCVVEDDHHGVRLGDYLVQLWPFVDRVFLRNLVRDGSAQVNGEASDARYRLRTGDVILVALPDQLSDLPRYQEPEQHAEIAVLYEDAEVLVVDKPAGLRSVPDRGGKYLGLQGQLQGQLKAGQGDVELRVFNRLASDTSGCTLLTKNLRVHKRLEEARKAPEVSGGGLCEDYLALVTGVVRRDATRVARAIGPDPRRPGLITVVDSGSRGARAAVSLVSIEEPFRAHTMVRVRPETARAHQVRAHLSHLGHPVVADRDYGVRDNLLLSEIKRGYKTRPGVVERPLLERMFLHVARLAWPDQEGEVHTVEASLPPELDLVLSKLRSFAPRHRN